MAGLAENNVLQIDNMKIYLGSSTFDEQLTNVGCKHRLLSYFNLTKEKGTEDQLALHRETGIRRPRNEGIKERKRRLEQGIDPSWDTKKQEAIKSMAYGIQDAFDNLDNSEPARNKNRLIIGKLLSEAKNVLKHGEYEKWQRKTFPLKKQACLYYRKLYETFDGYENIVYCLPYTKFLLPMVKGKRPSNTVLRLIDADAEALSQSDLGTIMNELERYRNNNIKEADLIQTIEQQIDVGNNRLHNKEHHVQHRGQLNIDQAKKLVEQLTTTIARIEKYDYGDADFYEVSDHLFYLERLVEWLQELIKSKDVFAQKLYDRDLDAFEEYLGGLSEQGRDDLAKKRMEENDRYPPLAVDRVYPEPKGTKKSTA